eukprot:2659279-Amphidinium_carterae.1
MQGNGYALEYATEVVRGDREVVLAAVQRSPGALEHAADFLLEDASFATVAKRQFYLIKLTMLSGRSTVVALASLMATICDEDAKGVLAKGRRRLGLADHGATLELWHGSERVPADVRVADLPGIQPKGEISEYQLVVRRCELL